MSLTHFTTGISLKLRNKAMSPVFSKKMGKPDQSTSPDSENVQANQNEENNHGSIHLRRLASDPQILSQDVQPQTRPTYNSEGENDDDPIRVKSKIKSKYSRAVPLSSNGSSPSNRTNNGPGKADSRKNSVDNERQEGKGNNSANITLQIPLRAEVTIRDGSRKDPGSEAYKSAMLSEKTRLRLQQVSAEHQAASEKRQIEKEKIDKERERTIRDLRQEEDDSIGDETFSATARDSDDSVSTTSDSNSSSRKESLDSLSSPVATRKYQVVTRRISSQSDEGAPVYALTPAEIEQREREKKQLDLFLGQFEVSDDDSKSSPATEGLPSPESIPQRNITTVENLGAKSLDEKLRILLDPNFQEKDGKLVRRTLSSSSSNSNTSPIDNVDLSRSYRYASQGNAKKANFAASIRGLDRPLKTKVIGLNAAKLSMPVYSSDMAARFDTFKQKKQELEKKVSSILQETSKTKSIYDNESNKTDEQKVASLRQKSQFSQSQRMTSPTQRVIVSASDISQFPTHRGVPSHVPSSSFDQPSRHHIESSLQRLDRNVQQVVELLQDSQMNEHQSENSELAALLNNLQRQASSDNDYLSMNRTSRHPLVKSGSDERNANYQSVSKRGDAAPVKSVNSGKGDLVRVQQWRTGSDQTKHEYNKFYPR